MKKLTKKNVTVGELWGLAGFPLDDVPLHYTEEVGGYSDFYGHSGDRYWMQCQFALFNGSEWITEYDGETFMAEDVSIDLRSLLAKDAINALPLPLKAAYDALEDGE
jgi:hypothetical protein